MQWLIASDASANTKKKITVKSEFYSVTLVELTIGSAELGALLGKSFAPMTLALTDDGFAREIVKACAEN
jgi:ribosomal protein L30E